MTSTVRVGIGLLMSCFVSALLFIVGSDFVSRNIDDGKIMLVGTRDFEVFHSTFGWVILMAVLAVPIVYAVVGHRVGKALEKASKFVTWPIAALGYISLVLFSLYIFGSLFVLASPGIKNEDSDADIQRRQAATPSGS